MINPVLLTQSACDSGGVFESVCAMVLFMMCGRSFWNGSNNLFKPTPAS